jgi:hypothetical protein
MAAPIFYSPPWRGVSLALGLMLGTAGLAPAATSNIFDLKPEETPIIVLRGDAPSPSEVAAKVVVLEGVFAPGREVRIWASERMEFRPGFGAKDAKISYHVGPAPVQGLGKQAVVPPSTFSVEAVSSSGNLLLRYALPRPEKLAVRIVNVSGKTVFARDLGPRAAGRHSETLHTPSFKAGVYVVRVTSGKSAMSRRVYLGTR